MRVFFQDMKTLVVQAESIAEAIALNAWNEDDSNLVVSLDPPRTRSSVYDERRAAAAGATEIDWYGDKEP